MQSAWTNACNLFEQKSIYQFESRQITGVVNRAETTSHISYCVTAKSHIIHMGTHEHHPIYSSVTRIPLLS